MKVIKIAALILLSCTACSFDTRPLSEKYPSISKARSIGSKCSKTDSASVKREDHHPLGPTGGWHDAKENLVDYTREKKNVSNSLVMKNGCISGYLKFDEPGYLEARSYDDYLGDVYCGWSGEKLELKPTKEPVFVSLAVCSVGDGGLDQVHEVGWFPSGKEEGVIVFSTAHSAYDTNITAADLFQEKQLGNEYRFNDYAASEAISSNLKKRDLVSARKIVDRSFSILSSLKNSVDGATRRQIPARDLNKENWAMVLSYSMGLNLGKGDFEQDRKEMLSILSGDKKNRHLNCEIQEKMLPLNSWLNDQLLGKKTPLPEPVDGKINTTICSWNPDLVTRYLKGENSEEKFLKEIWPHSEFWVGVKYFVDGDRKQARPRLENYLKTVRASDHGFELAASAVLLDKIAQDKKKKK